MSYSQESWSRFYREIFCIDDRWDPVMDSANSNDVVAKEALPVINQVGQKYLKFKVRWDHEIV